MLSSKPGDLKWSQMAISAFQKNPFGFQNFIFVRISKICKMKNEIESDSWVRTDLKRLKFLDKKFTFSVKKVRFWKRTPKKKIGSGFKLSEKMTDSLKSDIFSIGFDLNWSEWIGMIAKMNRLGCEILDILKSALLNSKSELQAPKTGSFKIFHHQISPFITEFYRSKF